MSKQVQKNAVRAAASILLLVGSMLWTLPALAQNTVLDLLSANSPVNLLTNGGFEADTPAYWEATGTGATWTTEQARTPGRSLKLSGQGDDAWTMAEAVRNWVAGIPGAGNPEVVVGGWVYTDGVNTNPASDDEKFQLVYEFFDENGTDLLGGPLVLDLPQDAASSNGWIEISSLSLGAIALEEQAAKSVRITFRKGANATGTAYLEDIFIRKADPGADGWAGGWFNTNMDAGATWYYWWNGFEGGGADWPATQPHFQTVTDEQAHSGSQSLRIETNGANQDETVAISDRVPVSEGEPVLISFWVKHEGHTLPDSIGTGQNNLGLSMLWYENLEAGTAGYGQIGEVIIELDGQFNGLPSEQLIPLLVRETSSGWVQYAFVGYPVPGSVGVEIRLRYFHQFEGVTYWDDVVIIPLGDNALIATGVEDEPADGEVPDAFVLHQNYPNPFNPTTTIAFDLPQRTPVTLSVYNVLGQRVAVLINNQIMTAGHQAVTFDASTLSSGLYLYLLQTENRTEARKMVLLK